MYRRSSRAIIFSLLIIASLFSSSLVEAGSLAKKRDHLTPEEADLIRETQVIDKRIEIFVKAAERRLLALTDPAAATSKQAQKDSEKWGAFPKGTRAELLDDIAKILGEAITNIDDLAMRDAKNPLLAKALRKLAEASTRMLAQLRPMREQSRNGEELAALEDSFEKIQAILEAANKLPPPTEKKGKEKADKGKS